MRTETTVPLRGWHRRTRAVQASDYGESVRGGGAGGSPDRPLFVFDRPFGATGLLLTADDMAHLDRCRHRQPAVAG